MTREVKTTSDQTLNEAVVNTEEAYDRVENAYVSLNTEIDLLALDIHKFSEYLRLSHQLQRSNEAIGTLWASRPERYGGDTVGEALREQSEDRLDDINKIEKHLAELKEQLVHSNEIKARLAQDLQHKSKAIELDLSASRQVYSRGKGSDGELPPASPTPKKNWAENTHSQCELALLCRNEAAEVRTEGAALYLELTGDDSKHYEEVRSSITAKLDGWQDLTADLVERINGERAYIKDLNYLLDKLPIKINQIQQAQLRPEGRLTTRQARPGMECMADPAEAALHSEMEQLRASEEELVGQVEEIKADKSQHCATLKELEAELKDAEAAQQCDEKIYKKIVAYGTYIRQYLEQGY